MTDALPSTIDSAAEVAAKLPDPSDIAAREIDPKRLQALLKDLDAQLEGCGPAIAAELSRWLIGSFPNPRLADPGTFIQTFAAVVATYPEAVVRQAIHRLLRAQRFLPSVAEFCAEADYVARPLTEARLRVQRLIAARAWEKRPSERASETFAAAAFTRIRDILAEVGEPPPRVYKRDLARVAAAAQRAATTAKLKEEVES